MIRSNASRSICVLLAIGCGPRAPSAAPPAPLPIAPLRLTPCRVDGVDREARCGTLDVFEDRAARTGRKIGLHVVVLPATTKSPLRDPVFWLHGGPGAPATQVAPAANKGGFLAQLTADHDLVFVDQRGTGDSNPLTCDLGDDPIDLPKFFGELFPTDEIRACRAKLAKLADLRMYTTPIAMDDLDDVRASLGYDKIDLVAASYGTIAALVYVRQHAEHVRSVFLAGVANPNIRQPLPFAKGAQHAIDRVFEDCATDPDCHRAYPDLQRELAAVLERFDHGPVTAELVDPSTKHKRSVTIVRGNFVERLRLLLYTSTFASFVPLIIHRAYAEDYVPFEALAIAYNPGSLLARGMYLTVTCSESVPFITPHDIVEGSQATFVGDYRVRVHIAACQDWPRGDISPSYVLPVKSSVPVLMISGDLDASTPPWLGKEALGSLPQGRQVEIRYYGHQLDSPCIWKILADFVAKGEARTIDTSCTTEIRRPPFALELPPALSLQ